jgi:hypothetical protein
MMEILRKFMIFDSFVFPIINIEINCAKNLENQDEFCKILLGLIKKYYKNQKKIRKIRKLNLFQKIIFRKFELKIIRFELLLHRLRSL